MVWGHPVPVVTKSDPPGTPATFSGPSCNPGHNSSLSMEVRGKAKEHPESLCLPIRTQILRNFLELLLLPPGALPKCLGWALHKAGSDCAAGGHDTGGHEAPGCIEGEKQYIWERKIALAKAWQ